MTSLRPENLPHRCRPHKGDQHPGYGCTGKAARRPRLRYNDGEVLSGVQRRRRWTPEEKVRIVEETYLPGMSASLVARQHGISGSQVFTWRRLMSQGALTAAAAGEEVVPASDYRALEAQVRELHRLLGKKAMENELLREAVSRAAGPKKLLLRSTSLPMDGL